MLLSSVESLYVAELMLSFRKRLPQYTYAKGMPIVVEEPIASFRLGSADVKPINMREISEKYGSYGTLHASSADLARKEWRE